MDQLADEIRQFPRRQGVRDRWASPVRISVSSERTLAIHRLRLFALGSSDLRHRPPVCCPQDHHRTRRRLRRTAAAHGLTGYQERAEPTHDWVESSHASAALSYADGLSKAFELRGEHRTVVAVVGDGALTGWDVLGGAQQHRRRTSASGHRDQRQRPPYAPTIGGLAQHLAGFAAAARLRADPRRRVTKLINRCPSSANPPMP